MIDNLPITPQYGATAILAFVVLAVITGRLVWHTAVKKAEDRADRWEQVALRALGVSDKAVRHAEVTHDFLKSVPEPDEQDKP